MPLPNTKNELQRNLCQAYVKLDAEFDAIDIEYERFIGIEGNVSCCDIVAYQKGLTRPERSYSIHCSRSPV